MRCVIVIHNGKQGHIFVTAKRKNVDRYANGRIVNAQRGEKPEDVLRVALNNPERKRYGEMGRSQLAGYPLGKMMLHQKMTSQQVAVIERAGNIIGRYLSTIPDAKINGKGPSWARFTKDDVGTEYAPQDPVDHDPETEDERDERARYDFDRLQRDLADCGFSPTQHLITKVHVTLTDLQDHEVGDLLMIANGLARVWKARREY
jgi:hypothetical protein